MAQESSVLEWARTATFAQPLRLGEVEAGILGREPLAAEGLGTQGWLHFTGAWLVRALMFGLTLGAASVGLALLVIGGTLAGSTTGQGWFLAAQVAFFFALVTQLSTLRGWWELGRRRSLAGLLSGGLALLPAGAAYAVLATADDRSTVSWLAVLVVATGVLGAVILVLEAISRPEGRKKSRKPPRRGPRATAMWARYRDTRTAVLDILIHRGLVKLDGADRTRILEMPMGYWDELDGVGEAEWRRILELRSVGWRDFDESDRRPWPPGDSGPS